MKRFLCIMLIFGISTLFAGCSSDDKTKDNKTEATSEENNNSQKAERRIIDLKEENSNLTYDDFKNMDLDATYDQYKATFGEANMLVDDGDTKTYTWKMGNNKNISITVKNGLVKSKAQGLLCDTKVPITKAQFDSLKTGMTFDEVKAITGEGILTNADTLSDGVNKKMYSFQNADLSSAILTFQDDKLYSTSQNNLN